MEKCTNCHKKFSIGQVVKSSFLAYRNIKCSNCGTHYEHAISNKFLIGFIGVVSLVVVFTIDAYYNWGSGKFLLVAIMVFALTAMVSGFLRFKKVE
ncbi:TIGR04104 family putative zinc finger protein [Muriicola marianensis]|uniref:TIGR04104 family putative zinc finger protein n=1 Tax=Muriicola marianensis TaxID=1324801 RepID=UPI00166F62CA